MYCTGIGATTSFASFVVIVVFLERVCEETSFCQFCSNCSCSRRCDEERSYSRGALSTYKTTCANLPEGLDQKWSHEHVSGFEALNLRRAEKNYMK